LNEVLTTARERATLLRKEQAKRSVPTSVYVCALCTETITIWGTVEQREVLRAGMTANSYSATLPVPGQTKAVAVPELEASITCGTCMRDLHHYKCYGTYPRGSILWELRLKKDSTLK
jgi:hypothetical protein